MNKLNFQDGVSLHMSMMEDFHKKINCLLLFIMSLVCGGLIFTWISFGLNNTLTEQVNVELMWTVLPSIVLCFIGFPSLSMLYKEFPDFNCSEVVNIFAHQWYWSFNSKDLEYDSFMKNAKKKGFRKLEVDKPLVFFVQTPIRLLVSSADVIHSFAIPSMSLKIDAVPGRMNDSFVFPLVMGKFYGQCSEMCGANHSFMPISVEVLL